MIFGCVLLVVGPTIFYLHTAERLFTAQVEVLIEAPEIGDNLLERSYGKSRLTEASIQTEADILESSSLADRVIDALRLDQDPEFNRSLREPQPWQAVLRYVNPLPLLTGQRAGEQSLSPEGRAQVARAAIQGAFLHRLTVKSHKRSFVITASFSANNGEKAAACANKLADLYVLDRLESSLEDTKRANDWLAQRLEDLRRDVGAAEQAAAAFRAKYGLTQRGRGDRQMSVTDQQLFELNSRLVLARSELAQKQARYDQLRVMQRNHGSLEKAYDVLQSPLIQRLREQETIKERELSEAMKTYGDRHPRIIGARADLDELRSKITQEIEKIASALATETDAARVGVSSLQSEISQLQRGSNEAGGHEVELRELERQAETSRSLYEAFLTRYKRDVGQDRIQRANARVLSRAVIPLQPSSPHRVRVFLAALLVSLAGGVGAVFLLDRLNGRIRSTDEVEPIIGLPLLGVIPQWKATKSSTAGGALAILDAPRSQLASAIHSLRAVLSASAAGGSDKITLVTSSVPQEGKSFVTRSLAISVAATGKRVLVIDGDLMRPTQHKALGVEPQIGLTQLLSDPRLLPEPYLVHDERAKIDILPAGEVSPESGHALASNRLVELIARLADQYDRVFIDAPPCLASTDVQVLSGVVNQVLFLVKWNHTPRDAIRTSLQHLEKVAAPVSGVVLSQVDMAFTRKNAYASYGYYGAYEDYARKS